MLTSTKILGVKITTSNEEEILKYIENFINSSGKKGEQVVIFTPNPEQISAASGTPELVALINKADIALPDGVGLVVASGGR